MHALGRTALLLSLFSLLCAPFTANAASLTWNDCREPASDPVAYISPPPGVDVDTIALMLGQIPAEKTVPITYGDLLKGLVTLSIASECFSDGRYNDGLVYVAKGAGESVATAALRWALHSVGLAGVTLPAEAFNWTLTAMIKGWENEALRRQMVLYIAAMEGCESYGVSRAACSEDVLNRSIIDTDFYPAGSKAEGFIALVAERPANGLLTDNVELGKVNKPSALSSLVQIKPADFYRGAYVIYNTRVAEKEGNLDDAIKKLQAEVIQKAVEEAKKSPPESSEEQEPGGFFSALLKILAKPFKFAGNAIKNFFTNEVSAVEPEEKEPGEISNTAIDPRVSVSPLSGIAGTTFDEPGFGFTPDNGVTLYFKKPDGTEYPTVEKETDDEGNYTNTWKSDSKAALGTYQYWAVDRASKKASPIVTFEITKLETQTTVSAKPPTKTQTAKAAPEKKSEPQAAKAKSNGAIPGKVAALLVDQSGKPVADAKFWLVNEYGENASYQSFTNANGRLQAEGNDGKDIPQGSYTLHIEKKYYEQKETQVTVPKEGAWLDTITLRKHGAINGLVLNDEGETIYQAKFWLTDKSGEQVFEAIGGIAVGGSGYTNKAGRFETISVPPGHYTLHFMCSLNCFFTENEVSALKDDLYAKWSASVQVDVEYSDVHLGMITLIKGKL